MKRGILLVIAVAFILGGGVWFFQAHDPFALPIVVFGVAALVFALVRKDL